MLFQKKVDRAMEYSAERAVEQERGDTQYDPKGKDLQEEESLGDVMEKGDLPALILSAMLIFVPVCLLVVLLICFFGALPLIF